MNYTAIFVQNSNQGCFMNSLIELFLCKAMFNQAKNINTDRNVTLGAGI